MIPVNRFIRPINKFKGKAFDTSLHTSRTIRKKALNSIVIMEKSSYKLSVFSQVKCIYEDYHIIFSSSFMWDNGDRKNEQEQFLKD